jgi:hypothetical protein
MSARRGSWPNDVRAGREAHRENRALARVARHDDIAAHHARELAGDCKAEASAAKALRGRGIGLGELLKQLCLRLGRHPDTAVGGSELDLAAFIGYPARLQLDLALLRELARIGQQIQQDLPQPQRVDRQSAEVLLRIENQAVLVLLGTSWRAVPITSSISGASCKV